LFASLSTKKAKERWHSESLGVKTLREINSQEKTWDRASLRKEVLSKVLKKTLEARF
jgi:hypothetical protein